MGWLPTTLAHSPRHAYLPLQTVAANPCSRAAAVSLAFRTPSYLELEHQDGDVVSAARRRRLLAELGGNGIARLAGHPEAGVSHLLVAAGVGG